MIRIKTAEEIVLLREGGRRHARILRELATLVKPGVTTKELDDKAHELIIKGGDVPAFLHYKPVGVKRGYPATLCVSINDEIVHGIPTEPVKTLQEGDIVALDLGLTHNDMITDAAITVPVGKISKELRTLIAVTEEALYKGIKAIRPGSHVGDIGAVIAQVARAHNYGVPHELSGHGVGYSVHEDPYVPNEGHTGDGPELKPGMVIAIEPMFSIGNSREVIFDPDEYTIRTPDGSPSAHFEHTIVITNKGAEILTKE